MCFNSHSLSITVDISCVHLALTVREESPWNWICYSYSKDDTKGKHLPSVELPEKDVRTHLCCWLLIASILSRKKMLINTLVWKFTNTIFINHHLPEPPIFWRQEISWQFFWIRNFGERFHALWSLRPKNMLFVLRGKVNIFYYFLNILNIPIKKLIRT